MGYPLVSGNKLMINVHYLNSGATPINPTVSIKIQAYKPGVVKTHVGTLFLNQINMSVPVGTTPVDTTSTWGGNPGAASADGSYTIFTSWSHMHKWATKFQALTNNQPFYTEANWDSPQLWYHEPLPSGATNPTNTATGATSPVHMAASQSITWTCTYYNPPGPGAISLTFGDSAQTNVMCIYLGQYYPASPTAPDVIHNL
jgi:hypothetical protein